MQVRLLVLLQKFFSLYLVSWTSVESRTVRGAVMVKLGSQGHAVFSDYISKTGFLSTG